MEEKNKRAFLGRGWSFPPTFSRNATTVEMVSEEEDVKQSLEILLNTSIGERILLPEYGCNLRDFQFEPMNSALLGLVRDVVETAIIYYEPRIRLQRVDVSNDSFDINEGRLLIEVEFTLRTTNSRFNLVFPFSMNEAIVEVLELTQQR